MNQEKEKVDSASQMNSDPKEPACNNTDPTAEEPPIGQGGGNTSESDI